MALATLRTQPAYAQLLGTFPEWDGTTTIQPFGGSGNNATATYGQTLIDPAGIVTLNDFTFYIHDSAASANLHVQGVVLNWGGSLVGASGDGHGVGGSPLWLGPTFDLDFTGGTAFQAVTVSIPGGVPVVPGQAYFFGLTTSGGSNYGDSIGDTQWGATLFQHNPNNGGGGFVFFNNGSDVGALTDGTIWDNFSDFGDLAFDVNGTTDPNIPQPSVPDGGSTAALMGLTMGGMAFARRLLKK